MYDETKLYKKLNKGGGLKINTGVWVLSLSEGDLKLLPFLKPKRRKNK